MSICSSSSFTSLAADRAGLADHPLAGRPAGEEYRRTANLDIIKLANSVRPGHADPGNRITRLIGVWPLGHGGHR